MNDPFATIKTALDVQNSANDPLGRETAVEAHEEINYARRCVHLATDKLQESYNRRGLTPHLHQSGKRVWMSMKHVSLRHPSHRHNLVPKYYGPIPVLDMVCSNCIRWDLPESNRIHDVVNMALIEPFRERRGQEAHG